MVTPIYNYVIAYLSSLLADSKNWFFKTVDKCMVLSAIDFVQPKILAECCRPLVFLNIRAVSYSHSVYLITWSTKSFQFISLTAAKLLHLFHNGLNSFLYLFFSILYAAGSLSSFI